MSSVPWTSSTCRLIPGSSSRTLKSTSPRASRRGAALRNFVLTKLSSASYDLRNDSATLLGSLVARKAVETYAQQTGLGLFSS
jgi:hypothetical protein